jgi:hypothetical protein
MNQPKTATVRMRVSKIEQTRLNKAVELMQLKTSELLRIALFEYLKKNNLA